ncbi:MAG: VWA domain-containing protein [Bacteroidales bacterium]|nr:VWA domain-containing protein [Bacteroidales bacterium]
MPPAAEKTRVLLILDCSQSMWDKWQSDAKIKVAQHVLLDFLDSVSTKTDIEVALRVFGHLNKDAFSTKLEVPFGKNNKYQLQSKIKTLVPNGGCTASTALNSSLKDFPTGDKARNIILIITDGVDDSESSICDVVQHVQQSANVARTYIIGIGNSKDFQEGLDCDGQFSFLASEELLGQELRRVFFLSDQKAQVTIHLTDANHEQYETEVPFVFYDHGSHTVKYSGIYHYDLEHSLDTLVLNPLSAYDVAFFTKPVIRLFNRKFAGGKHTALQVQADQGSLSVGFKGGRPPFQVPSYSVMVRQHDSARVLAIQPLNASMHYLAGRYDVDLLSLPTQHIANVSVRGGADTGLQLPLPGQVALSKPKEPSTGSIYVLQNGSLQWVCDLDPASTSERIVLMPGEYQVILKPVDSADYAASRSARFTIVTAKQTAVTLE